MLDMPTAVTLPALAALLAGAAWPLLARRRRGVEERQRLQQLADAAVEGLLVCRGDDVIASNQALRDLLRLEAAPERLSAVLPEPLLQAARQAGRSVPLEVPDARGQPVPVEVSLRPVVFAGQPHCAIALRDLRDRREAEARVRFMAYHDPLTKLHNRASLQERLEFAIAAASAEGRSFRVLVVNIDRFQRLNGALGTAGGDALLVETGQLIAACLGAQDLVARVSGDEFAVLLADAGPDAATRCAKRIQEAVAKPVTIEGRQVEFSVSIGIACFPGDGETAGDMLAAAQLATAAAKQEGRGRHRYFDRQMQVQRRRRQSLEADLQGAIAHAELELFYQPLFDVAAGQVTGFEALLRWRHPIHGFVSPMEFIPIAEESGLILPIGDWVLQAACREAAQWPADATVAVNLSPAQFRGDVLASVRRALDQSGLPPARLELEVTESLLIEDSARVRQTLQALKALGIAISLDDFGTGYSSLSYLRSFPFSKIKIDRCFIRDVTSNPDSRAIVQAIIGLGHGLGMTITVEGVETEAQFNHVCGQGCDRIQGYLIGKPQCSADAGALLRQRAQQAA